MWLLCWRDLGYRFGDREHNAITDYNCMYRDTDLLYVFPITASCWADWGAPCFSAALADLWQFVLAALPTCPSNGTPAGPMLPPPPPLHHDHHHHQGGWLSEDRMWKEREREKMGAASLHHPHPLTEMLNLLSAPLSLIAGAPICMQMVSAIHCRLLLYPFSQLEAHTHIPKHL